MFYHFSFASNLFKNGLRFLFKVTHILLSRKFVDTDFRSGKNPYNFIWPFSAFICYITDPRRQPTYCWLDNGTKLMLYVQAPAKKSPASARWIQVVP